MSRNALILERAEAHESPAPNPGVTRRTGEYTALATQLGRPHSVLAVVGADKRARVSSACRGIAAELSADDLRVVIVRMDDLEKTKSLPPIHSYATASIANVWSWPSLTDDGIEFYNSDAGGAVESDWLGALQREFDVVVLECSARHPEVAALADSAVLVAESGKTDKEQVKSMQRTLARKGVKLTGCILMQQR
jgi:hypothetical protein